MTRSSIWPRALATALVVGLLHGRAAAQSSPADELDQTARAAFAREDYPAAARAFDGAFALAPHAATKYNAALAWDKAGDLARAADAYALALKMGTLDDERARACQTRLTTLTQTLGLVVLVGPIGSRATVAHAVDVAVPAEIHLVPGRHDLVVQLPDGTTQRRRIDLRAGATERVQVVTTPSLVAPSSRSPSPSPSPSSPRDADDGSTLRTLGWVSIGVGATALGGTIALGVATLDVRDDFVANGKHDVDARDRAVVLRALTNVALGVSVLATVGGVVLLATHPSRRGAPRAEVRLRPLGADGRLSF